MNISLQRELTLKFYGEDGDISTFRELITWAYQHGLSTHIDIGEEKVADKVNNMIKDIADTMLWGDILVKKSNTLRTVSDVNSLSWSDNKGWGTFGFFADLEVEGITQRFRWIPPGKFLMGSPENEKERLDNETQHEVVITKGYWLAETACTQALWEAVMGNNPSSFKGKENPVDTVSWNDAMEFIKKMNTLKPALNLGLPTEAEWEYACRAGTTTPFSFGENITTDQVNYDGNYPYSGGKKGEFRKKTVPVKSFPCNNWGLYEMHGNVQEWCADWYGENYYKSGDVIDPIGPSSGVSRVLRGGCWDFNGRNVRSAYRDWNTPGYRDDWHGFRLIIR